MPTPRAKILVADDSATEREDARKALCAAGYEVVEAVNGPSALEIAVRDRPDLIMLDVVMPRLSGLETCRILKAKSQGRYLPIIMVSARNSVNARVEGLRSGADDYLGKPYDSQELCARVDALLRIADDVGIGDKSNEFDSAEDGKGQDSSQSGSRTLRSLTSRSGSFIHPSKAYDVVPVSPSRNCAEAARSSSNSGPAVRRQLETRVSREFDRAQRYSDPLACLHLAIDQYDGLAAIFESKDLADIHRAFRSAIEINLRKIDLVFEIDEGDFVVLLPNTHFPGALAVAERILVESERILLPKSTDRYMSASVGVSFFPSRDTRCAKDLLSLGDLALDHARREGGGKICLFQHQGYIYAPDQH